MSLAKLPAPIQAFLSAVQARDPVALTAVLGTEAVVVDEGLTCCGDAIAAWLNQLSADRIDSHRPVNDTRRDGQMVITVLTEEADRDGNVEEVLRDWHFTTIASQILAVRIERRPRLVLAPAVTAFLRAINRCDLDGLVASFVDDALVNDQLRDYWGKAAIRQWAAREVVGQRMTIHVVNAVQHYGRVVVTANVNGDFDHRGLPDPLALSFYFSIAAGRISQLIMLRNEAGE